MEDPDVRRQLEVVEEAAREAARTMRRVQEFVRTRRERPFFTVELGQLVDEVLKATRGRWKDDAEARGIEDDVRVAAAPAPAVAGDPLELREALTAIVHNALDAMPAGGRLTLATARQVLEDALRALGCEVTASGDGTPAIARLDAEPFDVVVTDLGMPGASGWDVARHVRSTRPATKIVLVTGWGAQLTADDLAAAGIDQLVLKPFEINEIEAAVRRGLGR